MKNTDTEIGKRLKLLRQEAGLKQSDIADLVGHSNTAVGRIERGEQTIDLKTILAYKKQFNVVNLRFVFQILIKFPHYLKFAIIY